MLVNVIIGLFFIFAAWLIVDFILGLLVKGGTAGTFSGLKK
jgi:hypothetical protein